MQRSEDYWVLEMSYHIMLLLGAQENLRMMLRISSRQKAWRRLTACLEQGCCFALGRATCNAPAWWRAGRPREVHRSYAEVELLSCLAELLMPEEPIAELFRDFPVEPSKSWGARWLCPDITAHGVLKRQGAALFVEYDGHPQHYETKGLQADARKTQALLKYAPHGSCVVRIGHAHRGLNFTDHSMEVRVDTWRPGHNKSLLEALRQAAEAILTRFKDALQADVGQRLRLLDGTEPCSTFPAAGKFVSIAILTGNVEAKKAAVCRFLEQELHFSGANMEALAVRFPRLWGEGNLKPTVAWLAGIGLSRPQVAKVIAGFPKVLGYSIEGNLKPTVAWLEDIGLSQPQVAKVVAGSPQVLGCSIEGNLKPTVAWLEGVGLSRPQVAKVVAGSPQVLGYSIEGNLKPTVAWFEDIGLSRPQVAKVIARFPQVLGYSIEGNLKPTVAWLEDVGLSRPQVAKVVAGSPRVLGCSIEGNLKPTVAWLACVGLSRPQVAKVVAGSPQVLGYSIEGNLKPTVAWFEDIGLSRPQVAKVIVRLPQVLGYSIEGNLKPTVAWLEDIGLSQPQVAKVIVRFPPVLGCSIKGNLKPTVAWLEDIGLSRPQVAKVIARFPQLLGLSLDVNLSQKHNLLQQSFSSADICAMIVHLPNLLAFSFERLDHRLHVLQRHNQVAKLAAVMTLTESRFAHRYP